MDKSTRVRRWDVGTLSGAEVAAGSALDALLIDAFAEVEQWRLAVRESDHWAYRNALTDAIRRRNTIARLRSAFCQRVLRREGLS